MANESPNTTTLQSGLGRASRRTGNRLDRLTERNWWLRQQVTFPLGAVPIAISIARTYYNRCMFLGAVYLLAEYRVIVPGGLMLLIGAYLMWELVIGGYLFATGAPKFDLAVRVLISVCATSLIWWHFSEGLCEMR